MFTTGQEKQVKTVKRPKAGSSASQKSRMVAPVVDISAQSRLLLALDRYPEAKRDVLNALRQR